MEKSPAKISKAMDFIQQVVSQESPASSAEQEDESLTILPWSGVVDPTKREDIRKRVLALSESSSTFLTAPPDSVSFEFEMTSNISRTAQALLKIDENLQKARYELVRPRRKLGVHVIEREFWRNYFYQVSLITDEIQDTEKDDGEETKSFQEEHFGLTSNAATTTTTSDDLSKLTEELETTLKLNDDDLALTTEEDNTGSPILDSTEDLNAALELDLASEDFSISDKDGAVMEDLKRELGLDDSEWELLKDS